MRRYAQNSKQQPAQQTRLFVREPDPGEEIRIYPMKCTEAQAQEELRKPKTRLFVEGKDSRGTAVKFIATYGRREEVWYPETEGQYLLVLTGYERGGTQLHFGEVSSPQPTKAAIHRLYLDIIARSPELAPRLKCVKRPCVFCAPHPDEPDGWSLDIDLASLPPACGPSGVSKFYM